MSKSVMTLWDHEADVVVAGAGGAGIAASIELADAKVSVIVFDKQPTIKDSSSSLCGGVYAFAGTDFQKNNGVQDSDTLFYKDLITIGQSKNDEKLVRAYIKNQLDTYNWMTQFGVKWIGLEALAGMSVPRGHVTDPAKALEILQKAAEKRGVQFAFSTPVSGLLTDANKRVIGVTVEIKGERQRIKARKGVLLASGGFGRDPKRLATIDARFLKVVSAVGPGHTGDGHRMAEELGAYLKDVEYVKPTFGIFHTSNTNHTLSMMYYNGAIIVNKEGKRFIDESKSYKDLGKASLAQPDAVGYQIFDQKIFQMGVDRVRGLPTEKALWGLDEERIKLLIKADTIEDLADKAGISRKALKQTVDEYNKSVLVGKDAEFGRYALAGGAGKIISIEIPPFYCYPSRSVLPGTYGGIAVDDAMHVLTHEGIIPGLYAAGEIIGGFHGASYMSGTAVAKAVIFGRIAGRNLAKS